MCTMLLGYNTNGFAHHDLFDTLALLADIGYRSVAISIDHGILAPADQRTPGQLDRVRTVLDRLGMRSVIETGARFLLDPRQKHEPTLVCADANGRARRIEFYRHAIDVAAELGSDCVSIWSGMLRDDCSWEEATGRLVGGLEEVLEHAAKRGIPIGFEPEPGMLIDSTDRFEELLPRVDSKWFELTLDIGHLHCQGETPIAEYIRRWSDRLINVHIEDMKSGVHQHLMFGDGQIDFPPVLEALAEVGYPGGVHVELSRHGHDAPNAARRAFEFLEGCLKRR